MIYITITEIGKSAEGYSYIEAVLITIAVVQHNIDNENEYHSLTSGHINVTLH